MIPNIQRPFFKSAIYYSSDPGTIPDALMRGFNVIVLVDVEETKFYPGCFPMSSLLPPPSLVTMILNSDQSKEDYKTIEQNYYNSYTQYMASPIVENHIVNFLAGIYKTNKNILVYCEYDVEKQFGPLRVLHNFFLVNFGINLLPYEYIFQPQQPMIFNPQPEFIYRVIELLFTNNYVTKEEYACVLPNGAIPSERAISILLSDYNYAFPTMEAAVTAACNIIDVYRQQVLTGRIIPVIEMSKNLDACRMQQVQQIVSNSNIKFGKPKEQGALQSGN